MESKAGGRKEINVKSKGERERRRKEGRKEG